jgi:hypothetical protein
VGEGGHRRQSLLDQLEAVLHGRRPKPALVRPQRVHEGKEHVRCCRDEPPKKREVLYCLHMLEDRQHPFGGDVVALEVTEEPGEDDVDAPLCWSSR